MPLTGGRAARPDAIDMGWMGAHRDGDTSGVFRRNTMISGQGGLLAVRSDEHGDGRPAIGFDFIVVRRSRLIEACDNQKIGSFEKRGKQAGGPERIGHVQNRLRVQLTQQDLDLGDDMGGAGFEMELA